MAAITVTAASVVPTGTYSKNIGTAGEALTQGQIVYKKSSDSKWYKAQADGTQEESGYGVDMGVALAAVSANQLFAMLTSGTITCGGTVAAALPYFVHTTAGSFGVLGELGSTNYVTCIGYATSTTVININFFATGLAQA